MKNFRIQIRYHGYYADFTVKAEDTAEGIEKSILDKLGKNEVKLEKDGFTNKRGKWITYEEVNHDRGPVQTKEVLGVKLGAGAS
jgi:hypothetical protein